MKHYRILESKNVDGLAEQVETAINDGWEIAGNVFTTDAPGFFQPILKITADRTLQWRDCVKEGCNDPTDRDSNYCAQHKPNLGGEQ